MRRALPLFVLCALLGACKQKPDPTKPTVPQTAPTVAAGPELPF